MTNLRGQPIDSGLMPSMGTCTLAAVPGRSETGRLECRNSGCRHEMTIRCFDLLARHALDPPHKALRAASIVCACAAAFAVLDWISIFQVLPGTCLTPWDASPAAGLALLVIKGLRFAPWLFLARWSRMSWSLVVRPACRPPLRRMQLRFTRNEIRETGIGGGLERPMTRMPPRPRAESCRKARGIIYPGAITATYLAAPKRLRDRCRTICAPPPSASRKLCSLAKMQIWRVELSRLTRFSPDCR
jgi:hypothetical protein